MRRSGVPDQLVQKANQASGRLWSDMAALEVLRNRPLGPGDLVTIPGGVESGDVEWAVLETDERGRLRVVPADTSPLQGSADVQAPNCRVLRCALATWLDTTAIARASRTGTLDADTLAAAQDRCHLLKQGRLRVSPQALETDLDPEYKQFLRGAETAGRALRRHHSDSPTSVVSLLERRPHLRHRTLAIAASLLLAVALLVILVQWRTIEELRRAETSPIVDPPVVWLEAEGNRGTLEVQSLPDKARYVLLLISPERTGTVPDDFVLEILRGDTPLWSGELQRGSIPELFVLVPRHLLQFGEYRLELIGRRDGEDFSAGSFRMRVVEKPTAP